MVLQCQDQLLDAKNQLVEAHRHASSVIKAVRWVSTVGQVYVIERSPNSLQLISIGAETVDWLA
jgi:hypothetical protein